MGVGGNVGGDFRDVAGGCYTGVISDCWTVAGGVAGLAVSVILNGVLGKAITGLADGASAIFVGGGETVNELAEKGGLVSDGSCSDSFAGGLGGIIGAGGVGYGNAIIGGGCGCGFGCTGLFSAYH